MSLALKEQNPLPLPQKFHSEPNKDTVTQGPKIYRNWDVQILKLAFPHLQTYPNLHVTGVCCYEYD